MNKTIADLSATEQLDDSDVFAVANSTGTQTSKVTYETFKAAVTDGLADETSGDDDDSPQGGKTATAYSPAFLNYSNQMAITIARNSSFRVPYDCVFRLIDTNISATTVDGVNIMGESNVLRYYFPGYHSELTYKNGDFNETDILDVSVKAGTVIGAVDLSVHICLVPYLYGDIIPALFQSVQMDTTDILPAMDDDNAEWKTLSFTSGSATTDVLEYYFYRVNDSGKTPLAMRYRFLKSGYSIMIPSCKIEYTNRGNSYWVKSMQRNLTYRDKVSSVWIAKDMVLVADYSITSTLYAKILQSGS